MKIPSMGRKIQVGVDSNEQDPLLFPSEIVWTPEGKYRGKSVRMKIEIVKKRLVRGDYCILGYEMLTGIERKSGVRELMNNFYTEDRKRAMKAFDRFAEIKYPYLLLDCKLNDWLSNKYVDEPERVRDSVYRYCHDKGLRILWSGGSKSVLQRKALGGEMVRLMWNHVFAEALKGC